MSTRNQKIYFGPRVSTTKEAGIAIPWRMALCILGNFSGGLSSEATSYLYFVGDNS
ncbi:MAG: hypothetical protein QXK61_08090 [Nitrososphaerota archaeon]